MTFRKKHLYYKISCSYLKTFLLNISWIILFFWGCNKRIPEPPDISNCTLIEIKYQKGTLYSITPAIELQNVLSQDEKKYIESFEYFVIKDQNRIKAFAEDISQGTCTGKTQSFLGLKVSKIPYDNVVNFICYNNDLKHAAFNIYGDNIETEDHIRFSYSEGTLNLEKIEPLELRPFRLRVHCAWIIKSLFSDSFYKKNIYPKSDIWCDEILKLFKKEVMESFGSKEKNDQDMNYIVSANFTCPSLHIRHNGYYIPFRELVNTGTLNYYTCNYAMNPNCKPDSPSDMVLLFETKDGWNQNGGPELFTFDNHDPKGGCVLFNNGTVKFIRTEEELNNLRWK